MGKKETTKDRNGYLFTSDLVYLRDIQLKTGISISNLISMSVAISKEKLDMLASQHEKILAGK